MISCYPQNNEHKLTSNQLKEKTDKIMSEIPFQDRMAEELDQLIDNIRKCAGALDNPEISAWPAAYITKAFASS